MTNTIPPNARHKKKFAKFFKACELDTVNIIVASLWVLGDTIEEIECNIAYAKEHGKSIILSDQDIIITKAYID